MTPELVYITEPYDEEGDPQLTGLCLTNQGFERVKLVDKPEDLPAFLEELLDQFFGIALKEGNRIHDL